jgi:hypothetical protein
MMRKLQPKILCDYLEHAFRNRHHRQTFDEIARGLWQIKCPGSGHIRAIRDAWQSAQKQLRRLGTCAILMSETYFEIYEHREPRSDEAIRMCLALQHKAHGVRLLSLKNIMNDPVAQVYFRLRVRNVKGMMSAIADRVATEYEQGKVSKPKGRTIIRSLTDIPLPEHHKGFLDMMGENSDQ